MQKRQTNKCQKAAKYWQKLPKTVCQSFLCAEFVKKLLIFLKGISAKRALLYVTRLFTASKAPVLATKARYLAWNYDSKNESLRDRSPVRQKKKRKWPFNHVAKSLPQSTELKASTSLFQSESEVSPCFELKYNFLERHKKPLTIPSTRKRQNHNGLDKKTAEGNEGNPQGKVWQPRKLQCQLDMRRRRNGSFQGEHYLTNY